MDASHDQHCLAIGRMIVSFQSLEATMKGELALLMNNELGTVGGALTYAAVTELSFGTTVRIIGALSTVFTPERLGPKSALAAAQIAQACEEASEKLKKGLKLATEVEERRNQIVHSHWFISDSFSAPEGKMTRMKAKTKKGTVSIDFVNESLADIEGITVKAGAAHELIGTAMREYQFILKLDWDSLGAESST